MVNTGSVEVKAVVKLPGRIDPSAILTILKGGPSAENSFEQPRAVVPETVAFAAARSFIYVAPAHSLTVIRVKKVTVKNIL